MRTCVLVLLCLWQAMAAPRPRIAFIILKDEGFRNPFWDALQLGARKAAKEFNVELIYYGIDPSYQDDRVAGQSKRFQEVAEQGAQAIVFTPTDRSRMVTAVKNAVVRDIKVIAIDSPVESDLISGQLGTNNYQGGLLAAKRMAKVLHGKGKVILLCHPMRKNQATRDRERAFVEGLHEYAPAIKVLSQDRCGTATIPGDSAASAALFTEYPKANGFYCVSGSCLPGAIKALQALPANKKWPILIGWDASPEAMEGLRQGAVEAILLQDPEKMGYLGVKAAVEALQGKENRFRQDTGVHIADVTNLDSPIIRKLTHPDLRGWLD